MAERRKRRPRDPIALAKLIGDIATGQVEDREDDGKNPAAVELGRVAIGPIDLPQARLRIEQPQGEAFEGLSFELGRENIEVAGATKDLTAVLRRIEFVPFVAAGQGLFQFAVLDPPTTDQEIEVVVR